MERGRNTSLIGAAYRWLVLTLVVRVIPDSTLLILPRGSCLAWTVVIDLYCGFRFDANRIALSSLEISWDQLCFNEQMALEKIDTYIHYSMKDMIKPILERCLDHLPPEAEGCLSPYRGEASARGVLVTREPSQTPKYPR